MPSSCFFNDAIKEIPRYPMSNASPKAVNRLLAALPDAEYQRLIPHLEHVSLSLKQVLYEVERSCQLERRKALAFPSLRDAPLSGTLRQRQRLP